MGESERMGYEEILKEARSEKNAEAMKDLEALAARLSLRAQALTEAAKRVSNSRSRGLCSNSEKMWRAYSSATRS